MKASSSISIPSPLLALLVIFSLLSSLHRGTHSGERISVYGKGQDRNQRIWKDWAFGGQGCAAER
ncbi:hypothetical protein SLEP1_g19592 [Rubroshorea leprosula]|uniref:Uncharacterized protein n=1 Tax=Rubroshorea leprosula TaxID=152421 RepID=A0AAV5J5S5_9ROSI|nr:hypothetical protein SLEP1_g19592 [Rubroshorea leprosula]